MVHKVQDVFVLDYCHEFFLLLFQSVKNPTETLSCSVDQLLWAYEKIWKELGSLSLKKLENFTTIIFEIWEFPNDTKKLGHDSNVVFRFSNRLIVLLQFYFFTPSPLFSNGDLFKKLRIDILSSVISQFNDPHHKDVASVCLRFYYRVTSSCGPDIISELVRT